MTVYLPDAQKYIDKLIEIVEENFSNPEFGVAELAREMRLSHSTLHQKLKAIDRVMINKELILDQRVVENIEILVRDIG